MALTIARYMAVFLILAQPVQYMVTSAVYPPPAPSSDLSRVVLQQVHQLAYRGDIAALRSLWAAHNSTITAALAREERTPVHSALQGRHDSLSRQSLQLQGHHEETVSWLLGPGGVSADQGCPLYHAMHYRNMMALESLLTHASMER